jgi:hypothetical protein
MIICGEKVNGITWENTFSASDNRKAVKFFDSETGYYNDFVLPDRSPNIEEGYLVDVLALNFLRQVRAYRQSMIMVNRAVQDAAGDPLSSVVKDDK